MKYTNIHGLPQSIVDAINKSTYDIIPDQKTISVTQLINPPLIRQLTLRHQSEITEDISENIWRLLGSAVHSVMERIDNTNRLTEERLSLDMEGVTFTGRVDLYEPDGTVQDYKVTSAWSIVYRDAKDKQYEYQLNSYAYLYRKTGFQVNKLRIIAILRDWSKSKAKQDRTYPQLPIAVINIPLWTIEQQEEYIKQHIILHTQVSEIPDELISVCSPEERWAKPTTYAVYKGKNKKATKIFLEEKSAKEFVKSNQGFRLEIRVGEDTKCINYCSVAPFCFYWKQHYGESVGQQKGETNGEVGTGAEGNS